MIITGEVGGERMNILIGRREESLVRAVKRVYIGEESLAGAVKRVYLREERKTQIPAVISRKEKK